jgi:hypothetical protein
VRLLRMMNIVRLRLKSSLSCSSERSDIHA